MKNLKSSRKSARVDKHIYPIFTLPKIIYRNPLNSATAST